MLTPPLLSAQERGAIALGEAVQGIGGAAATRVLLIGAHPDDEDTFLIAWLSRGRAIETAYLSLTRGDGGQNLIGNELGEALGAIRTQELLAARRVDGARQYFTRAYDFGFSKDTIDTYAHWPRDSILGDVVRIVRAFRPHVIVAVFRGTPRDGHGHHQVSGLLARAAYDVAGDTIRFPSGSYGRPWTPLKFYRAARFAPEAATLRFDAGEYSPLLGRSYAEIAAESRSQHKSQGFGTLRRKGPVLDMLTLEASRVDRSSPTDTSIFAGIDTTWGRFRGRIADRATLAALDSLPAAFAAVHTAFDPMSPDRMIAPLARLQSLIATLRASPAAADADLQTSLATLARRVDRALQLAASIEVEAFVPREVYPVGRTARAIVSVYNRGATMPLIGRPATQLTAGTHASVSLPPSGVLHDTVDVPIDSISQPWWLRTPRTGSMFTQPVSLTSATRLRDGPSVFVTFATGAMRAPVKISTPVTFRELDPVKGEIHRELAGAPAVSVTVDDETQFAPANTDIARDFNVTLTSADDRARDVRVRLALPRGFTADSAERATRLPGYGTSRTVTFHLRGRVPPGTYRITAVAESEGERFSSGYRLIDYPHIRRQRVYHAAATSLVAVGMRVPATLRVAYVPGVGDNVAPTLAQLGIPVTVIQASEIGRADLLPYTTVVIGPRAYQAHAELAAANGHLFDFVRNGGSLVVQYGQAEMAQPGIMPYPIALARPADRVTEEDAAVSIDAPHDRLLRLPNRIDAADFAGWVQERALYMPRTFDDRYRAPLSMHDRGEPANRGAVLATPIGKGTYIYTTLSLFRQMPAGVPGAARLFVNLLSASIPSQNISP